MAVTTWTSEGMDWSDVSALKGRNLEPYFEAVRLAIAERLLAIENTSILSLGGTSPFTAENFDDDDFYGGVFASDFTLENRTQHEVCSEFQSAISYLLSSKFIDNSCLASGGVEGSSFAGSSFSTLPRATEADILTALGEESRLPSALLQPAAEWLYQQYRILNLLDTVQVSATYIGHDGGQRYRVELTPWDEEWGNPYNLALAWAELGYFDLDAFTQNGWNYVYPVNGRASACSAVDTHSFCVRTHSFCEGSKWTFNFGLLAEAGLSFEIAALQLSAGKSGGLGQTLPISNEFTATDILKREGYSAMVPDSLLTNDGLLTVEIGNDASAPSMPAEPSSGTNMRGWKLLTLGPALAKFDFNFKS